jgi:hypothetical protein
MEQKKQYPKPIGAVWIKDGNYGQYMSISLEIDGVKHSYLAYANKFYEAGSNKPQWNIQPPKSQSKPTEVVDKYQKQLDNVMSQKAAMKAIDESQGSFTEEFGDIPF